MQRGRFWRVGIVIPIILGAYALGRWNPFNARAISLPEDPYVGFEPAVVDLGAQQWAIDVPISLLFGNWGGSAVAIERIDTSCGCLVAAGLDTLEGRRLEPGDAITLELTLDTQKRVGPQTRTVTVTLANGETHLATIDLDVVGTWSLSTDTLDFGDVALDGPGAEDPAQSVVFTAAPDQLRGEPVADARWLVCEMASRSENRVEILVVVRRDRLPPGLSLAAVFFRTTSPDVPSGAVYVRARGIQQLTCSPAHVFLRGTQPKAVRVSGSNGRAVVLTSVAVTGESIEAVITNSNTVEVRNKNGKPLPELFVVTVVDEQGRRAKIPVSTF